MIDEKQFNLDCEGTKICCSPRICSKVLHHHSY